MVHTLVLIGGKKGYKRMVIWGETKDHFPPTCIEKWMRDETRDDTVSKAPYKHFTFHCSMELLISMGNLLNVGERMFL